ncbi:hypothetical protein Tco_0040311, partial [Tanacetum coccineum]
MVKMVPYEAFACRCGAGDVVLRESYKHETRGKLYYACPRSKEERVRLLVGSSGASTTPIYSPGSSSTPIYSPGSSTPPRYSLGASTPPSYSLGTSKNAECSNCKHLLDKITILEATVDMYMHPEQYTANSAALFHEVYNNMGKLNLEEYSSSSMEPEVIEIDALPVSGDRTTRSVSKLKRKGKQNEVPFHEIIDLDMDEDHKDLVFIDGKAESNKKMKGAVGVSLGSGSSSKSDSKKDVHVVPAHFPKGFTSGSNECSALQAHFDNKDLTTAIEASIPLLPDLVDMKKKKTPVDLAVQSASAYFNAMGQSNDEEIPEQNMSSSYTSFGSRYHFSNNFNTQVGSSTSTFPLLAMNTVNPLGVDTPTFRLHKLHMKNHLGLNDAYPPKNWAKKIQEEWKILEKDLRGAMFASTYGSPPIPISKQ